jgi:hypothetical protein
MPVKSSRSLAEAPDSPKQLSFGIRRSDLQSTLKKAFREA